MDTSVLGGKHSVVSVIEGGGQQFPDDKIYSTSRKDSPSPVAPH